MRRSRRGFSLLEAIVGIAIATVSCAAGLRASGGALGVGLAVQPAVRNSVLLIGAVILFLVICTAIGVRRWRAAGLDVDGERLPDEDLQQSKS